MKKKRNRYRYVTMRLPYEDVSKGIVARDVVLDSEHGDDETGNGSSDQPLRTKRGIQKLIKRMTEAHEARKHDDFETKHKAEREAAEQAARLRREADEAERRKLDEEKKAKEKALDDKIAMIEVELTSLEKTYLETQHLFELAQLDLIVGSTQSSRPLDAAKALATQLHLLRMALMERSHEHDMFVSQRKSSQWSPWVLFGGIAAYALMGIAAWALFRGPEKK